jgi:predicted ATPase
MHRFIQFKGFATAEIDLFKPLTLLIGKNGSGKSNAIEGIELLAEIAHGRPLHEITDVGRGGAFEIRGGLVACIRGGSKTTSLSFLFSMPLGGSAQVGEYSVTLRGKPEPRIGGEHLVLGSRTLFETLEGSEAITSGVLKVRYDNFARGRNKPLVAVPSDRSVLSQYENFGSSDKLGEVRDVVKSVRDHLRASFVFDPIAKSMRQYERIGNRILTRHGGNLSAVLYALANGNKSETKSLSRILGWIRQLPEEPYEEFGFVTTELHDVIFGLREQKNGPLIDARVLSDGTLRSLAVLTALETAKEGSRVIIEEFDNGLHPSRTGILSQAIWETSSRRKLNVLCTTHNPATLDALTPEQLESVVLAYWDKEQQASRLIRLLDLPRADVLLERGHLGDLVTRRVLEQHLLPRFEEIAKVEAQSWLDSLP